MFDLYNMAGTFAMSAGILLSGLLTIGRLQFFGKPTKRTEIVMARTWLINRPITLG
jgi:hypothetical protein